ncbi:hypothetical protein ACOMHN_010472 [Nucella lapillus]
MECVTYLHCNQMMLFASKPNQRHGVRDLPALQPDDAVRVSDLPALQPDDAVRVKTNKQKKWTDYGRVMCPADSSGRSYIITSPYGVIRRNRQHLQKVPELPDTSPEPDIELPEDGNTSGQEYGETPEQIVFEPINTYPCPSNNQIVFEPINTYPCPSNNQRASRYGRVIKRPTRYIEEN